MQDRISCEYFVGLAALMLSALGPESPEVGNQLQVVKLTW